MGHGPAIVIVATLEQEHGVQRLDGRLTLAHAGGHGLAAGLGGRSGVAPAEPAGDSEISPVSRNWRRPRRGGVAVAFMNRY